MLKSLDYFLDRITMYRLVLYILIVLVGIACFFAFFQLVPYSPITILSSALVLSGVGWIANTLFSRIFHAPTNVESVFITALILTLIMSPAQSFADLPILLLVVVLAMLSKFVLAIGKKHIFNPAAISVLITAYTLGESASWWVGTALMAPFVAISGILIFRKLHFAHLAWSFFAVSLVISILLSMINGSDPLRMLSLVILQSSLLFMGSIMLTEPLTMPPTKRLQVIYAGLVGLLAVPQLNLFGFYFTPELALCVGNVFSYIVSPKGRLALTLTEKITVAKGAVEFVFTPHRKLSYLPGQYMEWTVPHRSPDSRGNRRYFTLASSPTEDTIRLGVKISHNGSSYKKALTVLDKQTSIIGAQLAGEFILPKNPKEKLVFLAGGIGITPFRSMIKYLLDTNESRDIVLCYANKSPDEIAYQDIFTKAQKKFSLKTVYTLTNSHAVPSGWQGAVGRIDAEMIRDEIPDFADRVFYLSGPQQMVQNYEKVLQHLGIRSSRIKKDFFPGLA